MCYHYSCGVDLLYLMFDRNENKAVRDKSIGYSASSDLYDGLFNSMPIV